MKKLSLILCAGLAAVSLTANPASVDPDLRKQSFDYDWKFKLGDNAEAVDPGFKDKDWRDLNLPHDWSIEGEIKHEHAMGMAGGFFPDGIGWYRKTFTVPASLKGKELMIYFEGVYMNSEVFLNGHSLGVHPYGYTSFGYDLTPHLNFGGENVIAVRVDNSEQQNCRWYSGSGIYRHVWLIATEKVKIPLWGVGITTPEVTSGQATVEVDVQVRNGGDEVKTLVVVVDLLDADGGVAGKMSAELEVPAHEIRPLALSTDIQNPQLWTPETPNLYTARLIVSEGEKNWDVLEQTFGVRSLEYSVDQGFLLNGERVVLNGGCVHHDNGCLGAAAYDRAEERRVELLKAAGFNAMRTSHNPPSESFLEACDRLGLMVIDEVFDGWKTEKTPYDYHRFFDAYWRRDVEAMVLRDRNHPSIIMWSHGNEIIERTSPEAVRTAQMLTDYMHQLDPTRPVTSALASWGQGWENFDPLAAAHDIVGYNYLLFHAEDDHVRVPDRIMVNTESYPINAFTIWDLVDRNSYIIGDFVWTAIDYLGESGIGRAVHPGEPEGEHWQGDFYPWHGAYCGDIDLTGWRKPINHYRSMLYNRGEEDAKLYMAVREPGDLKLTLWSVWPTWESWTWPGQEGQDIEVEVYSIYPKVQLYLGNQLIGERSTTRDQQYKAIFKVPYQPGELKAVGLLDGEEVESVILKTAGDPAKLKLTADRTNLKADGQDLSFVIVEVEDEAGTLQPNADDLIRFSIDGPGTIIAVENANLKNEEPYVADYRHAWNGRAMVVVRSEREQGDIRLTATAEGLETATVMIQSK